ncbi:hypothetical protein ACTGYR_11430, partial [Streptococcus suis]
AEGPSALQGAVVEASLARQVRGLMAMFPLAVLATVAAMAWTGGTTRLAHSRSPFLGYRGLSPYLSPGKIGRKSLGRQFKSR